MITCWAAGRTVAIMNKTYRRTIVFCPLPVDGFYRYNNTFQILPPDKVAPKPPATMAHHPLILEYCFDTPEVRYIPVAEGSNIRHPIAHWITINEVASEKLNEILRILSVVTNFRFFTYGVDQAWFTPLGGEETAATPPTCEWGQEFYSYPQFERDITGFSVPNCSLMDKVDPQSYYNRFGRSVGGTVDLPATIDDTIFKFCQLNDEARESFISSALLFCNGNDIWSKMKSLSFAAFISSIETLIAYDHRNTEIENCPQCGQPRFRVVHKFREFLHRYGSPDPAFKKYALKLYQTRSRILHRGDLFLGDLHLPSFGTAGNFTINFSKKFI